MSRLRLSDKSASAAGEVYGPAALAQFHLPCRRGAEGADGDEYAEMRPGRYVEAELVNGAKQELAGASPGRRRRAVKGARGGGGESVPRKQGLAEGGGRVGSCSWRIWEFGGMRKTGASWGSSAANPPSLGS